MTRNASGVAFNRAGTPGARLAKKPIPIARSSAEGRIGSVTGLEVGAPLLDGGPARPPRSMIEATARVLKNIIELKVGEEDWTAKPSGAEDPGIGRRIAALFATEYPDVPDERP